MGFTGSFEVHLISIQIRLKLLVFTGRVLSNDSVRTSELGDLLGEMVFGSWLMHMMGRMLVFLF